jgi:hypothetical protein
MVVIGHKFEIREPKYRRRLSCWFHHLLSHDSSLIIERFKFLLFELRNELSSATNRRAHFWSSWLDCGTRARMDVGRIE